MTRTGIEPATFRFGIESSTIEPPHLFYMPLKLVLQQVFSLQEMKLLGTALV